MVKTALPKKIFEYATIKGFKNVDTIIVTYKFLNMAKQYTEDTMFELIKGLIDSGFFDEFK